MVQMFQCKLYVTHFSVTYQGEEESVFRDKVSTLTSSLATVMQEKAKMEANYQGEKKQMKVINRAATE